MALLFTSIEVKNIIDQKWYSIKENDFWASDICERYNRAKDYKSIKIRPFECSENLMIDLFNDENFPFKINQYQSNDVLPQNDYLHFFLYWNDLSRLKYISFEDVLNFEYKKMISSNIYKSKKKWHYNKCTNCKSSAKKNACDENLTYENYLGKRFFEEIENLKKLGKPSDIRICFFIDDILE